MFLKTSNIFSDSRKSNTLSIIGEGIEFQKKTVTLFTINIGDDEFKYEINLPRSQWKGALESCLEVYQKLQATDEIIDTYLLIKETKKWVTKQS